MATTRNQVKNRLRKATALRFATQIRDHALRLAARRELDFPESVIMSILAFYHARWNAGCDKDDLEEIFEKIMELNGVVALEALAEFLGTNGGNVAEAA